MPDETQNPDTTQSSNNGTAAGGVDNVFLKPRLTGERFRGHSIPLEFLKDLAVIEEMVIEVAKWRFRAANPERQRSPRGFTDGVSMVLTGIEDGSVVPVIRLVVAATTLFPSESVLYYKEARDAIIEAISAAEDGPDAQITRHLPERALTYFNRIGRSLKGDEAIELVGPDQRRPARLTRETRRRLVFASAQAQELTEEVKIRGFVTEADVDKMSFQIQLEDGRRITGNMSEEHVETVIDALRSYQQTRAKVLIEGNGRMSRSNRLERLESVEHISLLDPLDVPARLDEFRDLKHGWLDGHGNAPSKNGLDWFASEFDQNYPGELPLPYLYPTESGGIRAEWQFGDTDASLDVDIDGKTADWHDFNLASESEESRKLNLQEKKDWEWFAGRVRELTGADV
ncbi:MAG: hypothetical protein ACOC0P_07610 [Planctomycetota bacterium]